ncbi:MAG: ABC transporter permease [Caulobacterales bacterium]|nr:ABC transporter permease [Caulobacterales bacterium]
MDELIASLKAWRTWFAIAMDDVAGKYRRTVLGPLWLVMIQAGFISGLWLLHRNIYGAGEDNFLAYLAVGLPLWSLLTMLVADSCDSLLKARGLIDSYPLPMAVHLFRSVATSVLIFAHSFVVSIIVLLATREPLTLTTLLFVPGLVIVIVFGFGLALTLGPLAARFRDLLPAAQAGMNLMFVLTPVFWIPTPELRTSPLLQLNPFYHMMEVVRGPLLGHVDPVSWTVASLTAVATLVIGIVVFIRTRPQITFWI